MGSSLTCTFVAVVIFSFIFVLVIKRLFLWINCYLITFLLYYLFGFICIILSLLHVLLCFNFNQYIFLYVLFPNFPTVTNIFKKTKIKKKELGWGQ